MPADKVHDGSQAYGHRIGAGEKRSRGVSVHDTLVDELGVFLLGLQDLREQVFTRAARRHGGACAAVLDQFPRPAGERSHAFLEYGCEGSALERGVH